MGGISEILSCHQILEIELFKKKYDAWKEDVQQEAGSTIIIFNNL